MNFCTEDKNQIMMFYIATAIDQLLLSQKSSLFSNTHIINLDSSEFGNIMNSLFIYLVLSWVGFINYWFTHCLFIL